MGVNLEKFGIIWKVESKPQISLISQEDKREFRRQKRRWASQPKKGWTQGCVVYDKGIQGSQLRSKLRVETQKNTVMNRK